MRNLFDYCFQGSAGTHNLVEFVIGVVASSPKAIFEPCASPKFYAPENSAIPSPDACSIQVIPSHSTAKILSGRNARAAYIYILRIEEP